MSATRPTNSKRAHIWTSATGAQRYSPPSGCCTPRSRGAIGAAACAWLFGPHADARWQQRTLRQAFGASAIGVLASALHFQVLVGDFARAGLAGMLDTALARVPWESPVGTALLLRACGFIAIAAPVLLRRSGPCPRLQSFANTLQIMLWLAGALSLSASFALGGHTLERGFPPQIAVTLDVFAMTLWLGALLPLLQACRGLDPATLHRIMARFGQVATAPVALLLACGALLIFLLLQQPDARIASAWGLTLGLKLLAATDMLLFAALHRWRLVPQLGAARDTGTLLRSIAAETVLAALVLASTATLSTIVGPAGM